VPKPLGHETDLVRAKIINSYNVCVPI